MISIVNPELVSTGVALIATGLFIVLLIAGERVVMKAMGNTFFNQPKTETELRRLLKTHNVPLKEWGQGKAKVVNSLWEEIQNGESTLLSNPLRRRVSTVSLIIRRGDHILIEKEQRLKDGRVRQRHIPPSEKLQRDENYLQAAYRGLQEELNILPEDASFKLDTHNVRTIQQPSNSYPGLLAEYHIHTIEVDIPNLPQHQFSTEEMDASNGQEAKSHVWDWSYPPPNFSH